MKIRLKTGVSAVASCALAIVLAIGNVAPAEASTALPGDIRDQYIAVFEARGIAPDVQASLLAKIESGQLPDADSQQVEPVSTETVNTLTAEKTRRTYPDGSVSEVVVQLPVEGVQGVSKMNSAGITGCGSYMSGAYAVRNGCTVYYNGISWSYTYKVDYRAAVSGTAKAYITAAYSPQVSYVIGGSVKSKTTAITRQYAVSAASPARTRMTLVLTLGIMGAGGEVTNYLYFNAHSSSAWVSYS